MSQRLAEKVIVATGAAGGIGSKLVQAMIEEGARVTAAKKAPYDHTDLIDPAMMAHPNIWLCGEADNTVTGQRYVAAHGDAAEAAEAARSPAAWPELAQNPVWPGNKPQD